MRLRKIEFIVIALTFAFVCFMGGYFAGSRGSVSFVTAPQQYEEPQQYVAVPTQTEVRETVPPVPAVGDSTAGDMAAGAADEIAEPSAEGTEVPAVTVQPGNEASGAPRGGDGKININSASRSELMDLPGIGNVLAGRIVDYRSLYGAYSSIDDIKRVSGIGEKRFEAIRNLITVN